MIRLVGLTDPLTLLVGEVKTSTGGTMEIIKKGNEIIIKHKLQKKEGYKISEGKNFKTISFYKKTQACMGYSSKTSEGLHVLLLDFDKTLKDVIYDDISNLTKRFKLPPFYLFTTGEKEDNGDMIGNYHAVCLAVHNSRKTFDIMAYANIDENFKDSPTRKASKSWVLRLGTKKKSGDVKFLKIIGNKNLDKKISTAHKKLLSKFFQQIKHPHYKNEDGLNNVRLQIYETKN